MTGLKFFKVLELEVYRVNLTENRGRNPPESLPFQEEKKKAPSASLSKANDILGFEENEESKPMGLDKAKEFFSSEPMLADENEPPKQLGFRSKIVTSDIRQTMLISLLAGSHDFCLLYRGSEQGFSAEAFHALVDGKGPTMSIIKSEHGRIFGLYTDISWQSEGQFKFGNGNTFKFALRDLDIEKMDVQEAKAEVLHGKNHLIATNGFTIKHQCHDVGTNNANAAAGFVVSDAIPKS